MTMFQITNEGPHCKEEATTQVLTSSRIKQLIAILIKLWFLAKPTPLETPDQLLVKRVQSAVVSIQGVPSLTKLQQRSCFSKD